MIALLLLILLVIPSASAVSLEWVGFERHDKTIDIYVRLADCSGPENLSVRFYYLFEQDIGTPENPRPPDMVFMMYDKDSGMWEASISRKYDASTIHYYLNITDLSTGKSIQTEPDEYSYTTPFDFKYGWCIAGFFIMFVAFEILIRYGKTKSLSRKEVEPEEEPAEQKDDSEK